jgi:hypothetical protein
MNTTVVTVDRVLLLHPNHLDTDAPDGWCARGYCGHGPLEYGGQSGCDMVQLPALVDVRIGVGYIPPIDYRAALPVVDANDVQLVTVCGANCAALLDDAYGWRVVPFDLKVVAE